MKIWYIYSDITYQCVGFISCVSSPAVFRSSPSICTSNSGFPAVCNHGCKTFSLHLIKKKKYCMYATTCALRRPFTTAHFMIFLAVMSSLVCMSPRADPTGVYVGGTDSLRCNSGSNPEHTSSRCWMSRQT